MSEITKKFEDRASPYINMIKGSISLVPTAIGLYAGYQQILSNNPITVRGLTAPGAVSTGFDIGRKLGQSLGNTKAQRSKQAEILSNQLKQVEAVDKIWAKMEERKVVVQSLLSTLEDPSNALPESVTETLKKDLHKLIEMSDQDQGTKESLEMVKKAVSTIVDSGNPRMLSQFTSYRDEFKHLGPQLQPIKQPFATRQGFYEVPDSDGHIGRIKAMLPSNFDVVSAEYRETTGQVGRYARIYRGNRWIANVPVDLSRAGVSVAGDPRATAPLVRMGEHGETAYVASRKYGWAPTIMEASRQGKLTNIENFFKTPEAMFEDLFSRAVSEKTLDDYNSYLREIMVVQHRGAGALSMVPQNFNDPAYLLGRHLNANQALNAMEFKVLGVEKLDKAGQAEIPKVFLERERLQDGKLGRFRPIQELDPGIVGDAMFKRDEMGRVSSSVALARASSVSQFKGTSSYIAAGTGDEVAQRLLNARFTLPITARESQVVGREHAIWDTVDRGIGASFRRGVNAQNVDWTGALTGASNRAVLLEVGSNDLGLDSMGEAFGTGRTKVIEHFTKPVLDPKEMGQYGTKLLEDLEKAGPGGLTLTREQAMKNYGNFIGIGPTGNQMIPNNPNMESIRLFLSQAADPSHGQKKLHISGAMTVNISEGEKFFSMLFKGSKKLISPEALEGALKKFGMEMADLAAMDINPDDLLVTTGDMLKKGPDILLSQMISGTGIVGRYDDPYEAIYSRTDRLSSNVFGDHKVGRTTEVILQELEKHGQGMVNGREFMNLGRVLAGVYEYGGELGEFSIAKDKKEAQALLESEVQRRFGGTAVGSDNAADWVLKGMKGRMALGATSVMAGPQPGDIKAARASIEIRTLKNLQQKLRMMGVDDNMVSDLMSNFLERKVGIEGQINLVPHVARMMGSVLGQNMPLDPMIGKSTGMSIDDFFREYIGTSKKGSPGFMEVLGGHSGITLDLGSEKTAQGEVIASVARQVFGSTDLYLPGKEAIDEMRSSVIRSTEGDIKTLPEFSKKVGSLMSAIESARNNPALDPEELGKTFRSFREDVNRFGLTVLDNIGRGKIKGSQFMLGGSYDLANSIYLGEAQKKLAGKVFTRSGGNAGFMTGRGFLSSLADFMGTNSAPRNERIQDTAHKLQSFFMSLESAPNQKVDLSRIKGVSVLANRHPNISPGHLMGLQIFRHVKEVGQADDESFRLLTSNPKIQKILKSHFGGAQSFADLRQFAEGDKKSKHKLRKLFQVMAGSLEKNAPEGGGIIFFPQIKGKASYAGGVEDVDISLNAPAIGDFDGDNYGIFHLNSKLGSALTDKMNASAKEYLAEDLRYRTTSAVFMAEAKRSMKKHSGGGGDAGRIFHDVMKEKSVKSSTPPLEIKMNMLRTSVMNYGEGIGGREQANMALALLSTLTEFASIKAKKLAEHKGWPEQLVAGIDRLFATGDSEAFDRLVSEEIFKGSELFGKGTNVSALNVPGMEFLDGQFKGFNLEGKKILEVIKQAALSQRGALEGNLQNLESVGQAMMALGDGNSEISSAVWRNLFIAGGNLQAAVATGAIEGNDLALVQKLVSQQMKIVNAAKRSTSHAIAPVMAGMLGSMVLGSMMGGAEYSSEPLLMPGETVSPQVQHAMSTGNLFGYGVAPENDRMNTDLRNRVINQGTTYMEQPSAYQVQGEIYGTESMRNLSSYVSSVTRGRSSMVINDTRRPISSIQLDEMMGE